MTLFETALEQILHYEGGYVNDPRDNGGETNMGISKRAHPEVDIKNLTKEQAGEIYKRDYWDRSKCDQFPAPIAIWVFDTAVNAGNTRAAKQLQRAAGATIDGIIGPKTIKAVNDSYEKDSIALLDMLYHIRLNHYRRLDDWKHYGRGWTNRINHLLRTSEEWIELS